MVVKSLGRLKDALLGGVRYGLGHRRGIHHHRDGRRRKLQVFRHLLERGERAWAVAVPTDGLLLLAWHGRLVLQESYIEGGIPQPLFDTLVPQCYNGTALLKRFSKRRMYAESKDTSVQG